MLPSSLTRLEARCISGCVRVWWPQEVNLKLIMGCWLGDQLMFIRGSRSFLVMIFVCSCESCEVMTFELWNDRWWIGGWYLWEQNAIIERSKCNLVVVALWSHASPSQWCHHSESQKLGIRFTLLPTNSLELYLKTCFELRWPSG